jgi:Transposase IS116/IS110/IS902 family
VVDAIAAARAVLSGEPATRPSPDGTERAASRSVRPADPQADRYLCGVPDPSRGRQAWTTSPALRGANSPRASKLFRTSSTGVVIRLARITTATPPEPVACKGVGPDTASTLLVAAGDNRTGSRSSGRSLCGRSPVPVNSGQTQIRYWLSSGRDRQANGTMAHRDRPPWHRPRTSDYIGARVEDGKTRPRRTSPPGPSRRARAPSGRAHDASLPPRRRRSGTRRMRRRRAPHDARVDQMPNT